jgi:hypothetical protein
MDIYHIEDAALSEDQRCALGEQQEDGHPRPMNAMLEEHSTRQEPSVTVARKQRAVVCSIISGACCGRAHPAPPSVRKSRGSAVWISEPAAWKETPDEQRAWIAVFDFMNE